MRSGCRYKISFSFGEGGVISIFELKHKTFPRRKLPLTLTFFFLELCSVGDSNKDCSDSHLDHCSVSSPLPDTSSFFFFFLSLHFLLYNLPAPLSFPQLSFPSQSSLIPPITTIFYHIITFLPLLVSLNLYQPPPSTCIRFIFSPPPPPNSTCLYFLSFYSFYCLNFFLFVGWGGRLHYLSLHLCNTSVFFKITIHLPFYHFIFCTQCYSLEPFSFILFPSIPFFSFAFPLSPFVNPSLPFTKPPNPTFSATISIPLLFNPCYVNHHFFFSAASHSLFSSLFSTQL